MMVRVFRAMSGLGVGIVTLVLVILAVPGAEGAVRSTQATAVALDGLGAVGAFCLMIPWPAAVWHWRRQYPPHPNWVGWGFAVILVPVIGALGYWLLASQWYVAADSAEDGSIEVDGTRLTVSHLEAFIASRGHTDAPEALGPVHAN